ncbi:unnamed protein product [Paramecium octaurelia]|uniref:Uncharacterized protein n=1 Tax=Paramecium octaurelia TaxID=43137 RepID=A0A8S1XYV2_PAROT|nr:unnamed protein product [Paramecium octaurelia]
MNNNYNYMFKFIVVGDAFVGKTSLLLQFQQKEFCEDTQSTVSIEFRQKTITLNDQSIKLQAWDPAGFTQFLSMEKFYYKGAIGALLVFDFSRRSTFEDIKFWLNQIKTFACDKIELVLVGNKSDLSKKHVTIQEVEEFAKQEKLDFYETSAKTGKNVDIVFESLASKILRKIETKQINVDDQMLGIKVNNNYGKMKKNNKSPQQNITLNGKQNDEERNEKQRCC